MTSHAISVIGAFEDTGRANRAVEDLSQRGVPRDHLRVVRPGEDRDPMRVGEMRAEMRDEASHSFAGPSIALFTPAQAKGAFVGVTVGVAVGALIGAVVGGVWASMGASALPGWMRFLIAFVSFATGGATIGFIAGGALEPRRAGRRRPGRMLDEERSAADGTTLVAVRATDPGQATVAHEVLEQAGALRVDDLDAEADPIDAPGYWSSGGRGGR